MLAAVKHALEGISLRADWRPFLAVQVDIRRQLDGLAGEIHRGNLFAVRVLRRTVHQRGQSRQLCGGTDRKFGRILVILVPAGVGRAIPHIRAILIIQQRDVVLTVILVLGGLLVLVLLVLVLPIGGLVLLILIGLVGVVAIILIGVLILVTGFGGLFVLAVLGVLVFVVLALVVPAGVSVSRVRIALDDGRTAAAHHLRGERRRRHQRQREHQAHQQAHHAPGHSACPFLHVICLLSLLNVSI